MTRIILVECLECDIQLREDELITGNYCPNCGKSNLFGYEYEVEEE